MAGGTMTTHDATGVAGVDTSPMLDWLIAATRSPFEDGAWPGIVDIATLVLALAALYLAVREFSETREARRIEHFQGLNKLLTTDSPRVRAHLKAQSDGGLNAKDVAFGLYNQHLLVHSDWCWSPGQRLLPLADVTTHQVANPEECAIPSDAAWKRLAPRRTLTLSNSLLLFTGDKSYDAPSFALSGNPTVDLGSENPAVALPIKVGHYFGFIDTCLPFGYDAADAVVPKGKWSNTRRLRQRHSLSDFNNRHAQIGIVTLVVIRNVSDKATPTDFFLLQRRSANVVESANLHNAVPGATFQPTFVDNDGTLLDEGTGEFALLNTVVREFCEELYDFAEFSERTTTEAIVSRPEWHVLKDHTYFVGMGLNPVNPYLEVLAVAWLDATHPGTSQIFGGKTTRAGILKALKPNKEGTVELIPFHEESLRHHLHQYRSAPALQQILSIILKNLDAFKAEMSRAETPNGAEPP